MDIKFKFKLNLFCSSNINKILFHFYKLCLFYYYINYYDVLYLKQNIKSILLDWSIGDILYLINLANNIE